MNVLYRIAQTNHQLRTPFLFLPAPHTGEVVSRGGAKLSRTKLRTHLNAANPPIQPPCPGCRFSSLIFFCGTPLARYESIDVFRLAGQNNYPG